MAGESVTARRVAAAGAMAGALFTLGAVVVADRATPAEECVDDGVIRVATGDDVSVGGARRALISGWRDTPVLLIEISRVADFKHDEMMAAAQSDPCQTYDLLIIDSASTPEFAAAGLLSEIRPEDIPSGLVRQASESGQWDGKQYALPFALDVGLLYRRDERVPESWDELWQAARVARVDFPHGGYLAQLADYEGQTVGLLELLRADGAAVVDDDGEIVLGRPPNNQRALNALLRMRQGQRDQTLGDSWSDKEAESLAAFAEGGAGYLRHWPYADLQLISGGRVPFHVSKLPGPATLGGSNLAITARSNKYDRVLKFVKFLLRPDNQQALFACGGYAPVVEAAYEDVRVCPREAEDGTAVVPSEKDLRELATAIKDSLPTAARPKLEHYTQFSEVFRQCVTKYVHSAEDPTLDDIQMIADRLEAAKLGRTERSEPCG
ncbi:extracellular solute-binding protein [Nonomuraea sp. NPDC049141]|uniref:extracellular solute-binding protein n=1 Tax=Nonomuraea sp. NPDC049141 TaxID=3155500 RepID=UPI0034099720